MINDDSLWQPLKRDKLNEKEEETNFPQCITLFSFEVVFNIGMAN